MKKTAVKIILDIVMTVLLVALMNTAITGIEWHEILGLGICGGFLAHKLLNLDWIKGMIKKLRGGKAARKIKIMLLVDALLLVGMVLIVVSGLFISEVVFAQSSIDSTLPWKLIHTVSAYGTLILVAVHLGLHWKMILSAFRRMFKVREESKPRKLALRIAALAIVVLGIKATVETNFFGKLAITQMSGGAAQQQPRESLVSSGSSGSTGDGDLGVSTVSVAETASTPTLNEFLSNMVCTACHKRCSLLSPQCGRGQQQAQAARQEYDATYANAEESITTENSTTNDSAATDSITEESANAGASAESGAIEDSSLITEGTPPESALSALQESAAGAGSSAVTYFEYLAILGMLTTATHYLVVLSDRKKGAEKAVK